MTNAPSESYCANHPDRETSLRCNRCEKPICAKCAVKTPTGYRCRECVRGHQKAFDNVKWHDYPLAIVTAASISYVGSLIASVMFFFTLFVAPIIGVLLAEAVRKVISRRRSRLLYQLVAAAIVIGALILPASTILSMLLSGSLTRGILGLVFQIVYVALVTSTAYYRLSGIQIR